MPDNVAYRLVRRPNAALVARAARLPVSDLYEAMPAAERDVVLMTPRMRPLALGVRVAGPAVTAQCPARDNLMMHKALQLAQRGVRVVGVDLTEQMLRQGQRRVAAAGMSDRVELVAGRAEQLPFPDAYFDALTFTYLLRYVRDPQATLTELARVLKPGGTMASLEFNVPTGALWGPAWWAYTRLLLPAGGLLLGGPEWYRVGRFLGPNISAHYRRYPVPWTVQAWQKAGFTEVGTRIMSLGGGLVMWGTRADS